MSILHTPVTIKHLEVKGRLVMPPMATSKAKEDGYVTDELCAYYAEKARGGFLGLVITEHSYVSPEGKAHAGQLSLAEDGAVPGLKKLVETIHKEGVPVIAQLNHAGGRAKEEVTGRRVVAPSAVSFPRAPEGASLPRELTAEEIAGIVKAFAAAAKRARQAGYDGVEIHSAHSYLLNQFFSPISNKRTDAYTGSTLEGRIRLHLEIFRAVREAVGEGYPVAIRLAACDYMEGGITVEDAVAACREFEKAGVDLLDISGGFMGYSNPESDGQGYFKELTVPIRKAVSVPVILTGGITEPRAAEQLLEEGAADLIGVGRALLKDSDWARKAMKEVR